MNQIKAVTAIQTRRVGLYIIFTRPSGAVESPSNEKNANHQPEETSCPTNVASAAASMASMAKIAPLACKQMDQEAARELNVHARHEWQIFLDGLQKEKACGCRAKGLG